MCDEDYLAVLASKTFCFVKHFLLLFDRRNTGTVATIDDSTLAALSFHFCILFDFTEVSLHNNSGFIAYQVFQVNSLLDHNPSKT